MAPAAAAVCVRTTVTRPNAMCGRPGRPCTSGGSDTRTPRVLVLLELVCGSLVAITGLAEHPARTSSCSSGRRRSAEGLTKTLLWFPCAAPGMRMAVFAGPPRMCRSARTSAMRASTSAIICCWNAARSVGSLSASPPTPPCCTQIDPTHDSIVQLARHRAHACIASHGPHAHAPRSVPHAPAKGRERRRHDSFSEWCGCSALPPSPPRNRRVHPVPQPRRGAPWPPCRGGG